MTQRLPIPGEDSGTWGDILNGFLEVSLNANGTIATAAISQAGGEVTSNKGIASGYASLNSSGLVPSTQLATGTASSTNYLRGDGTWVTPNSGSSSLVADSDVSVVSPANNQVLTYNSGAGKWENVAAVNSLAVNGGSAQTGAVSISAVQVAGDISGTATSPTVLTSNGNTIVTTAGNQTIAGTKTFSSTITGNISGNAATVTTNANLTGDVTSVGNATTLTSSSNVESIISANTTVTSKLNSSTAASTYAPIASPTFTGTPTAPTAENSGNVTAQLATILDINHVFNVKAYSATGNGSTDDTTAINNAIAAATASPGGVVFFPAGIYITQPLTLPPGTVLQGVSSQGYYNATATIPNSNTQSQLKLKSGSTGALISPYDGGTNLAVGVNVFDLALNCNGIAQPAINFPNTGGVTRLWLVDRCYIFNVGGSANGMVVGTGNSGVRIAHSEVFNGTSGSTAGGSGIIWEGTDGIIDDCWIGYWGTYGLQGSGSTDICLNVRGGGIFVNGFAGVGIGAPGVVLEGLSLDSNSGYGLYIAGYPVVANGIRFTGNTGSNFYIAANSAQVDAIGCRYHGTGTPYMFQTNGFTGLTINDVGTIVESGATFATAYSDYQGVGTIENIALSSSTALTINSALHTLLTSPSLGPGTWLVTATVSLEFSSSTSTFIDFAGALGTAVGTIVGTPAFALAQPSSSFEFGCLAGTVTFLVTVTTAGTMILEYESTSTGGGATALVHGVNTNLGSSTGFVCIRVF